MLIQFLKCMDAVLGKLKREFALTDLFPETLFDEQFEIRLIVNDENSRRHADVLP